MVNKILHKLHCSKFLQFFTKRNSEQLSISLAPKVITEESEKEKIKPYLDTLIKAINTKNVNNIALTGSYGSGKSTILKTFQKEYKSSFRFLEVIQKV